MAKKTTKLKMPPFEKRAVLERLAHAQERQLLVHVRRWIPDVDRVSGFVVGIGRERVALQKVRELTFDGWCLLRLKDIQAVSTHPDPDCLDVRVLKARGLWPPTDRAFDLDDAAGAVTSAAAGTTMLAVYDEFYDPDMCWIGRLASVNESTLRLLKIDLRGRWERRQTPFGLDAITRLEVGGPYQENLDLVVGPPPTRRPHKKDG